MGEFAARLRRFSRTRRKPVAACPTHPSCRRGHVFSTYSSIAGGHTVMRRAWIGLALILALCWTVFANAGSAAQSGGELHFCLRGEPKTFNPLLVEEDSSEAIRYLTGGVLIRLNRQTQTLEPGLALSWKVSQEGRRITFHLRSGLRFSDDTPFTAEDVAYTV